MSDPSDLFEAMLPLREPTFFILLSLVPESHGPGQKHGYAILKEVERLSHARVRLSTGTLYEALARLLDQGLIERLDGPAGVEAPGDHPGKPRKVYRLTRLGRRLLEADWKRMQFLLKTAGEVLSARTGS
jgi:DNA-binding PadR family transcriptional regulator